MPKTTDSSLRLDITIRITSEQADLIDLAASLSHRTRTDFILDAATKAAEDAILDQRPYQLDAEGFHAFQAMLDAPPSDNSALRSLMARKAGWEE